jgi:hypothetical protein
VGGRAPGWPWRCPDWVRRLEIQALIRITSAPENGGARPSAPSAPSAQEIVPWLKRFCQLPAADGRRAQMTRTVRGNHLKSNGGALADGADANIGRRSGQQKITTPPGPGGHKRAPHPLATQSGVACVTILHGANTPASHARCDLALMPRGVSRGRIAADERRTGGLGKGNAGQVPNRRTPAAITRLNAPARTHTRPVC